MEIFLRKAGLHRNGTIFSKDVQLLANTDDIDTNGHTKWDVGAAFSAIKRKFGNAGLAGNEGKTKYMLSASRVRRNR